MEDYCLGQEQILSPKIDCVFKLLFGDERHKDILKDFLRHAIMLEEDELDTVSITGTELKREYPEDKHGILDVSAKTRKGVHSFLSGVNAEADAVLLGEEIQRAAHGGAVLRRAAPHGGNQYRQLPHDGRRTV